MRLPGFSEAAKPLGAWLVLGLLAVAASDAAPPAGVTLSVQVVIHGEHTPPELPVLVESSDGKRAQVQLKGRDKPERVPLPGNPPWKIALTSKELWARALAVPSLTKSPLQWEVWPAGQVTARVAFARSAVRAKMAYLRLLPVTESPNQPDGAEVSCWVQEDGTLDCLLPAGKWRAKLKLPGSAACYFSSLEVPAGGRLPLGQLELRLGAIVQGRVKAGEEAVLEKVHVRLAELEPVPGRPAVRVSRDPLRIEEAVPDPWGRFSFSELGSGSYELAAMLDTCPPSARKLAVEEGVSLELTDSLAVSCGAEIIVRVDRPELVPAAGWTVRVFSEDPQEVQARVAEGILRGAEGWRSQPLPPGRYVVLLSDSDQTTIAAESVALVPPTAELVIPLDGVTVRGRAYVGDDPLACTLGFANRSGARRIVTTDDEGRFSVFLPRMGRWTVDLAGDSIHSFVHSQNLLQVDVRPDEELEVRFRDTSVTGKVLTPGGEPVPEALVTMFLSGFGQLSQVTSDLRGGFSAKGLSSGRWHVQAEKGTTSSLMQEVELVDGRVVNLVLVVLEKGELSVRVLADDKPIVGAAVHIVPLAERLLSLLPLPEAATSTDGVASVKLPVGTMGLRVYALAPGFALHGGPPQPLPVPGQSLELRLSTVGGALALPTEALGLWIDKPTGRLVPLLLANGEPVPSWVLQRWAWIHGMLRNGDSVLLPMMPPGAYHLCAPPASEAVEILEGIRRPQFAACRGGILPPGSVLALDLPRVD